MTSVAATTRHSPTDEPATRRTRAAGLARRHWPFLLLLAAAATIRLLAVLAISPGIWFSDSNTYIATAATGTLNLNRVMGYSLLVAPFWHAGSASALIIFQHLLGLVTVTILYALLTRRGAPRWIATLGVVPVALDGYLVTVEHTVMSETLYHLLLAAGLATLLWRERLTPTHAGIAGLLFGYAAVVRTVAVPFLAVLLLYLLIRRVGWRPIAAFALGWIVIAAAYAGIFAAQHGTFGFTESNGHFLYARVAPFANCAKLGDVPASQRFLCPDRRHPLTTNEYGWSKRSPLYGLPPSEDPKVASFARRVILHQPLDYAKVIATGVLHYFRPGHPIGANDYPVGAWQFPADPRHWGYPGYRGPIRPGDPARAAHHPITEPNRYVANMTGAPHFDVSASRIVHRYQRLVYSYGPLLAALLAVVLVALVLRRGPRRLRLDAALLAALVLTGWATAQAGSVFSYRYGMIGGVLMPVAAALAATALLRRTPPDEPDASSPPTA